MSKSQQHTALTKGFTLIEILVALSLIVLITLGLVGALRAMATSSERVSQLSERTLEMQVVAAFLRKALSSASPAVDLLTLDTGADSGHRVYFYGQPESLEWVGLLPVSHGYRGLHYLSLSLVDDQLLLRYRPWGRVAPWGEERFSEHVLLSEITGFAISYGSFSVDEHWRTTWPESDSPAIPESIRVSITSRSRHWPDIVVGVRTFGDR